MPEPADGVHTIRHPHSGLEIGVRERGAAVGTLRMPGLADGRSLVLGYANDAGYRSDPYFMGVTVGRYANRLANGRLRIDGRTIQLPTNEGLHTLHGGPRGMHLRRWTMRRAASDMVRLSLRVKPDDDGFPGTLLAVADIRLDGSDTFSIRYRAWVDAPCPVSLAPHIYFNLSGGAHSALQHVFQFDCDASLPVDEHGLPSGASQAADGGPFDFRRAREIDPVALADDPRLAARGGYDHCFVTAADPLTPRHVAAVWSPRTGVRLEIETTQPGMQFYTGNALRAPFARFGGFCLETQNWPDAPNHDAFPDAIVRPGMTYDYCTRYTLSRVDSPRAGALLSAASRTR